MLLLCLTMAVVLQKREECNTISDVGFMIFNFLQTCTASKIRRKFNSKEIINLKS